MSAGTGPVRCESCGAYRRRHTTPAAPAPLWTPMEVESRNREQEHAERTGTPPLTCPRHRRTALYATPYGWMCAKPRCGLVPDTGP